MILRKKTSSNIMYCVWIREYVLSASKSRILYTITAPEINTYLLLTEIRQKPQPHVASQAVKTVEEEGWKDPFSGMRIMYVSGGFILTLFENVVTPSATKRV
jgi:hypothetical protein